MRHHAVAAIGGVIFALQWFGVPAALGQSQETRRKDVPCTETPIRIAISDERRKPDKCERIDHSSEVESHVGVFKSYEHSEIHHHFIEATDVQVWTRFTWIQNNHTYFKIQSFDRDLASFWKDFAEKSTSVGAVQKATANARDYEYRLQTYQGRSCMAFRSLGHYRGLGTDSKALGIACLGSGFDDEKAKILLARLRFGRIGADPPVEPFAPRR